MEGLYIELANKDGCEYRVGAPKTAGKTNPIPAGPPTIAPGEAVDA